MTHTVHMSVYTSCPPWVDIYEDTDTELPRRRWWQRRKP